MRPSPERSGTFLTPHRQKSKRVNLALSFLFVCCSDGKRSSLMGFVGLFEDAFFLLVTFIVSFGVLVLF